MIISQSFKFFCSRRRCEDGLSCSSRGIPEVTAKVRREHVLLHQFGSLDLEVKVSGGIRERLTVQHFLVELSKPYCQVEQGFFNLVVR